MFKIDSKKGYIIHKTPNRYLLCKILEEYETQEEANKELANLLSGNKSERKLLKNYSKKPI